MVSCVTQSAPVRFLKAGGNRALSALSWIAHKVASFAKKVFSSLCEWWNRFLGKKSQRPRPPREEIELMPIRSPANTQQQPQGQGQALAMNIPEGAPRPQPIASPKELNSDQQRLHEALGTFLEKTITEKIKVTAVKRKEMEEAAAAKKEKKADTIEGKEVTAESIEESQETIRDISYYKEKTTTVLSFLKETINKIKESKRIPIVLNTIFDENDLISFITALNPEQKSSDLKSEEYKKLFTLFLDEILLKIDALESAVGKESEETVKKNVMPIIQNIIKLLLLDLSKVNKEEMITNLIVSIVEPHLVQDTQNQAPAPHLVQDTQNQAPNTNPVLESIKNMSILLTTTRSKAYKSEMIKSTSKIEVVMRLKPFLDLSLSIATAFYNKFSKVNTDNNEQANNNAANNATKNKITEMGKKFLDQLVDGVTKVGLEKIVDSVNSLIDMELSPAKMKAMAEAKVFPLMKLFIVFFMVEHWVQKAKGLGKFDKDEIKQYVVLQLQQKNGDDGLGYQDSLINRICDETLHVPAIDKRDVKWPYKRDELITSITNIASKFLEKEFPRSLGTFLPYIMIQSRITTQVDSLFSTLQQKNYFLDDIVKALKGESIQVPPGNVTCDDIIVLLERVYDMKNEKTNRFVGWVNSQFFGRQHIKDLVTRYFETIVNNTQRNRNFIIKATQLVVRDLESAISERGRVAPEAAA